MKNKFIVLAILFTLPAFSGEKPNPTTNSDQALLCSFYAVVASNYMTDHKRQSSWRQNGTYWLEIAYSLGANRNEDPEIIDEAINNLSTINERDLLPLSVSLYKSNQCFM